MPPKNDRPPAETPATTPLAMRPATRRPPGVGTAVFWTLVAALVAARAVWFQPGALDGIDRAFAFAKRAVVAGPAS